MNSYEDPALSYECDREAELVSLRARLAECEAECLEQARLNGMGSEREARLQARLAEAERKLDVAHALICQAVASRNNGGMTTTPTHDEMRAWLLDFANRAADSAPAVPDLMEHCCPSCGQPSGKGIDLFTYMAELVTKHPTAKGMLDLAMARATAGSAPVDCPHPDVTVIEVEGKMVCTCCGVAVRRVGHHDRADTFVTADSANVGRGGPSLVPYCERCGVNHPADMGHVAGAAATAAAAPCQFCGADLNTSGHRNWCPVIPSTAPASQEE